MQRWIRSWPARFVAFAIVFALILVPTRPSLTSSLIWTIALACAMTVAVASLRHSAIARRDARLVERAGSVTAPRDGEVVAVCGTIEAEGETLRSPIRGETCVAFVYSAFHFVEQKVIAERRRTELKKIVDYAGLGIVPAVVRGTGVSARIGAFPLLHDFGEGTFRTPETVIQARDYFRFTTFDRLPAGEMLEWIRLMDTSWKGRGPALRRDFRRRDAHDPKECSFSEQRVPPGSRVCAIGIWRDGFLTATPDQDLWLYKGSPEAVRDMLKSARGCGVAFAWILTAAVIAALIYLILTR